MMEQTNCPVCGVAPGDWHRNGCGWEQCAYCGGHAVGCGHEVPLDDRLRWSGSCCWWDACVEFGFFERYVAGRWQPCTARTAGAMPSLTRLLRECRWSRLDKRFVRRHGVAA